MSMRRCLIPRNFIKIGDFHFHGSGWSTLTNTLKFFCLRDERSCDLHHERSCLGCQTEQTICVPDDTQIFFAASTPEKVEQVINGDLAYVDQWYEQNGVRRNTSKYQAIVMGKTQVKPQFHCEDIAIPIAEDLEMLGVTVDDKMKFEKHIGKICRKVS